MTTWERGLPTGDSAMNYGDAPTDYDGDGETIRVFAEADWAGSYEFAMLCVWVHRTSGELRGAVDAGCSCPTPFGDLTWEEMLPIRAIDDVRKLLEAGASPDGPLWDVPTWDAPDAKLADIIAKVHRHLRDHPGGVVDGTATEDAGDLPPCSGTITGMRSLGAGS